LNQLDISFLISFSGYQF